MIKYQFVISIILSGFSGKAQQLWTLQNCIDSAIHNNSTIQQQALNAQIAQLQYKQSIYDFIPSISGSVNQSFNFGRNLDPISNEFTQTTRQNSSLNLNANLVLFNGMIRYYSLQQAKLSILNEELSKKIALRNLKLQTTSFYLQCIQSTEIIKLTEQHIQYTQVQENRMLALIKAELKTEYDLFEISSQKARDQLTLLKAQNDLAFAIQQLKRIMQIQGEYELKIDTNEVILTDTSVYILLEQLPEIQQKDIALKDFTLSKKIASGAYFPAISAYTGLGSGYSDSYFLVDPFSGDLYVPNFPTQFAENIYQSVSFSISIPIYNQHNTRTNEQIQLIRIENAKLERDKIIWEMSSTILQLQMDIKNAKAELESSIYVLNLTRLDFDQVENKYQARQINYAELLAKQDQLYTAQSNVVQAKYNYYFKMKILHLYHER